MSDDTAWTIKKALKCLKRRDSTLKHIFLDSKLLTNAEIVNLIDCLFGYPDAVEYVDLSYNQLTDEMGVKLAHYVASSSAVKSLNLRCNRFGEETYLAMAATLQTNNSLQYLSLNGNQTVEKNYIDATFVDALRINPKRQIYSFWWLYTERNDFKQLQAKAEQLGHPTLQMLLGALYTF